MFCSVSGKITKTTQWNRGHIFVFRLLCIKPGAEGRMAPTFHPARNRSTRELSGLFRFCSPIIQCSYIKCFRRFGKDVYVFSGVFCSWGTAAPCGPHCCTQFYRDTLLWLKTHPYRLRIVTKRFKYL